MLGKTNQIFKKIVYAGIVASILLAAATDKALSVPDSNSIVIDDVEFYVETDKSIYYLGENVEILYRLTKLGPPSATILCHQSPPLNIVVEKNGKIIWMEVQGWYQVMVNLQLFPSIPVEITSSWDMNDVNGVPVGPGTYDVLGVIYDTIGIPDVGVRITILPIPRTITVGLGAGYDFNTIQAAIDDAYDGDTIIAADGTYTGDGNRDIDFLGKAITLRSENGPDNCIIDCNGTKSEPHRGFYFHNNEDANTVLDGFTITNGLANDLIGPFGAGIYGNGTKATIQNNHIVNNVAFTSSFPTVAIGGGLYDCDGIIQHNIISGNHANFSDMESSSIGGGLSGCDGTIKDNIISNNSAVFGGGMEFSSSNPIVSGCFFTENIANYGGGMYSNDGSPIVTNCIFSGNVAMVGGGMYNGYDSNPMVINCTFSSNLADSQGGGIMNIAGPRPTVTNCILWGNMPDQIIDYDYPVSYTTVLFSDVQGGWTGLGNIDVDPCFADAVNSDYHLKSEAGRWDPESESWINDNVTSPCIDAGNPGCPLGGEPAPNGNRRNMGAYGGTLKASKSPDNWRSIADLTNDWVVDSNDLKVFVDYWLNTGECIPGDLNRNQFTNSADFALLAMHWLRDENQQQSYVKLATGVTDCVYGGEAVGL